MNSDSIELLSKIVIPELGKTLYMVILSTILSIFFGFIMAIILTVTDKEGLKPNKGIYQVLDTIINVVRSFPFIILVVAIIPLTRKIVGTSIGENAAIVPLVIAGSPFIARLIEGSLKEVDKGLIEAARSFGASNMQIVFKIMIKEAVPSIISGVTLAIVSILGCTAMAGAVGAGGLGAIALTYGYQSFNDTIMYGTVIVLIIIVQIIQTLGSLLYRRLR
ncbi:D-methionine ABC transporter permease protein MetI [Gottschalkia acidurici 9a]|uniref:D-methionine ABC transporter permease protein MetI n=1 Tax=Gottschalkia acidurici (strain ATCC 7906 / DSM 604 / BCRC 14475 / CIP 104303 / KCTC 5404 / NCIMB 10678 / 9a) TaxID=1128398 RepID=K0AY47_GOTA9|nr:methionine ABC transporter permease [Gottschalkia acidurici]AFS78159.1 D-methionine ABC transporter permease protein MetI [Gottschalkia acidurici 9a]